MHDEVLEGCQIDVRGPRNNFPLVDSPRYVFIAGGIGITPILTMAAAADAAGADWDRLRETLQRGLRMVLFLTVPSTVGLALDPTRVPSSGLDPGDIVDVIAVPNSETDSETGGGARGAGATTLANPTVLARAATVYAVQGLATDGGKVLLTVVVDIREAGSVAAYSTSNRVAVVEVAAGGGQ